MKSGSTNRGAIMYTLTNIDFSTSSVVSELPSDEIDHQDQTLDAKQGAALSDASAASPTREQEMTLEMAVFCAP